MSFFQVIDSKPVESTLPVHAGRLAPDKNWSGHLFQALDELIDKVVHSVDDEGRYIPPDSLTITIERDNLQRYSIRLTASSESMLEVSSPGIIREYP